MTADPLGPRASHPRQHRQHRLSRLLHLRLAHRTTHPSATRPSHHCPRTAQPRRRCSMTIDERSRRWHRVSHATTDDTTGPEPQRSACYPNTHHVHGVAGRCGRGRSTDTADQPCTGITVKTGRPIAASVVSVATPLTEPLRRTVEQPGIAGHHGHHFRMTPGPDQDGDSRFLAHPLGPRRPVVLHTRRFFRDTRSDCALLLFSLPAMDIRVYR
jgi:hypothetical protein